MKPTNIRSLVALLLSVTGFNNCFAEQQSVSPKDERVSIEVFDRVIQDTEEAINLATKVERELRLQAKANDKVLDTMIQKSNDKTIPVEWRDKYAASAKIFLASLKQSGKNQGSVGRGITDLHKRLRAVIENKKFYIDMMQSGEEEEASKAVKETREVPMLAEHWKTILKSFDTDANAEPSAQSQ